MVALEITGELLKDEREDVELLEELLDELLLLEDELLFELELLDDVLDVDELEAGLVLLLDDEELLDDAEFVDKLVCVPLLVELLEVLFDEGLDELLDELLELVLLLDLLVAATEDETRLDVLATLDAEEGVISLPVSVGAEEVVVGFSVELKLDVLPPPAPPPHALNNKMHKRPIEVDLYLLGELKQRRPKNIKLCIS